MWQDARAAGRHKASAVMDAFACGGWGGRAERACGGVTCLVAIPPQIRAEAAAEDRVGSITPCDPLRRARDRAGVPTTATRSHDHGGGAAARWFGSRKAHCISDATHKLDEPDCK